MQAYEIRRGHHRIEVASKTTRFPCDLVHDLLKPDDPISAQSFSERLDISVGKENYAVGLGDYRAGIPRHRGGASSCSCRRTWSLRGPLRGPLRCKEMRSQGQCADQQSESNQLSHRVALSIAKSRVRADPAAPRGNRHVCQVADTGPECSLRSSPQNIHQGTTIEGEVACETFPCRRWPGELGRSSGATTPGGRAPDEQNLGQPPRIRRGNWRRVCVLYRSRRDIVLASSFYG